MHKKNDRREDGLEITQLHANKFAEYEKEKMETARKELSAPQHLKFYDLVSRSPGVRTWQVARYCSIGYPPCRAGEINKKISKHGLRLYCIRPKLINGLHGETNSHAWFISANSKATAE